MQRFWLTLLLALPLSAQTYLVAPLANRSTDTRLDWIGESVSEAVREALVDFHVQTVDRDDRLDAVKHFGLRPTAALSVAALIKVGERTSATRLVHGEAQFTAAPQPAPPAEGTPPPVEPPKPTSRGTLRLTARILDLTKVAQMAEFTESGPLEDLMAVQSNLAWRILRFANPATTISRRDFRRDRPAVKLNALESYIRGLMAPTSEQKHRLFTQAARFDPTFTRPCFHLGRLQYDSENYREAANWLDKVPPTSPNFLEARFTLGLSRFEISDFEGARKAFEEVSPKLPVPEVWNNLGAAQARLNLPDAFDNFRRALEADPTDPDYHFNVGYMLWKRGDFNTAAERFRAVLDRSAADEDAIYLLGRCLKSSGPRPGDLRTESLERLKDDYSEPSPPPTPSLQ